MLTNVDFDGVAEHIAELLNIASGFCFERIPCWRGKGHVDARKANLLTRGWSRDLRGGEGLGLS